MEADLLRGLDPRSYEGLKVFSNFLHHHFVSIKISEASIRGYICHLSQMKVGLLRGTVEPTHENLLDYFTFSVLVPSLFQQLEQRTAQFNAWCQAFTANVNGYDQNSQYISLYDAEDVTLVVMMKIARPRGLLFVAAGEAQPFMRLIVRDSFRREFKEELVYGNLYALMRPAQPQGPLRVRLALQEEMDTHKFNRN